jgi:hypothetical protein
VKNDEARITNDKRSPNDRNTKARTQTSVRHSDFVIPVALVLSAARRRAAKRDPFTNVQRLTFNAQRSTKNGLNAANIFFHWTLDVERWTLNVFFRYHQIR